jgi:hypothetical protein
MTKLQGTDYDIVAKHTIEKRSFVVSAASNAIWSTERVLQRDEIIEVVSELAGPSAVTIHQSAPPRNLVGHVSSSHI